MSNGNIGRTFIQELVIGFGFFSGFWIAVGVNPEMEIAKAFYSVAKDLGSNLGFLFWFLPILVTIISLFLTYFIGGKLGLITVGIAFISGILFVKFTMFAIILLIFAIVMGFIVPYLVE